MLSLLMMGSSDPGVAFYLFFFFVHVFIGGARSTHKKAHPRVFLVTSLQSTTNEPHPFLPATPSNYCNSTIALTRSWHYNPSITNYINNSLNFFLKICFYNYETLAVLTVGAVWTHELFFFLSLSLSFCFV